MGVLRDLKKANEAFWAGKLSQQDLLSEGKRLRLEHWQIQKKAGIDMIPSNDFSFYDQVLDHIQLFGVRLSTTSCRAISDKNRPFRSDTQSTTCLLWTNTLLWEGASKGQKAPKGVRKMSMFHLS